MAKTIPVAVRVSIEEDYQLRLLAEKFHLKKGDLVKIAIREYLEQFDFEKLVRDGIKAVE